MNRSSQPPASAPPHATAGLPSRMPVASSRGHSSSARSTVMFACSPRSGSLNPSSTSPSAFAVASVRSFTASAPQIIGTNSTPDGPGMLALVGDQL